ncbi:hypothetical protein QF032_007973 [Streptomyces achromogenes]|uniref:Uncharacterized protein n=1 Tax=Streptomyces achromogenes TaxID=67255 RepID=A0ABU0QE46_STRAH|nr:hypothetical protein [Streptomyces achromogenes]MDQ0688945.1 hypothetical protein [Streptomyces achromogenes]MDQ0836129.1 hypothetical protein [Streptomyces achromogenes]
MGPDPRVFADDIWAKLFWAGLNVESGDLPTADGRTYPAELTRAITLTWLFPGQRSDEVAPGLCGADIDLDAGKKIVGRKRNIVTDTL